MDKPFDINSIRGLTDGEALERIKREGLNEIPSAKRHSIFSIAFGVVKEPMFILLISVGAIYLLLGDSQEAAMLLGFVFVIMGITLYQERKTERALEALRDLSSPRASVIRGGVQKKIPGREVARGDYIVITEGDRVPADSRLVYSINLSVDESLLTGESVPVRKAASVEALPLKRPGGDNMPFVFSSTLVVQGFGVAEVLSTGFNTEIGKIGRSLEEIRPVETPLQKETGRLVRTFALIGTAFCAIVAVVYGLTRGGWLPGLLAGLTLAMSIIPEEFPVILTVFLAVGAWRISKANVLTRRVTAVEAIGASTVLCVDKTGTITLNRMTVRKVYSKGRLCGLGLEEARLPEELHETVEFAILASHINPFDPMEKALRELGSRALSRTEHLHADWTLIQEYPLTQSLLTVSRVWRSPNSHNFVIASKGAPEAVFGLCHMDESEILELSGVMDSMAGEGLRVIGVARADFRDGSLPDVQHEFTFEFLGLIGLADPVRTGVKEAIKECSDAGIRVVMITGDYPATAEKIGSEIGIAAARPTCSVVTGPELDGMDDPELRRRINSIDIFARVVPEQKLRIVNALKSNGEIVTMTGDGVNDAAALKAANIGVALGGRGTDVAREASSMVLLDDDFSSIVKAVRTGRRIFDNIKKAMAYTLAVHIPIAGMSLIPVILNLPLVLLPVHIVFLELIIDPACSIVFEAEPEEAGLMKRPPRDLGEPLFNRLTVVFSVFQGLVSLAMVLTVFLAALGRGVGGDEARALSFTTLILANLGLIFTNRSWTRTILDNLRSKSMALWGVTLGAIFFLFLTLSIPILREVFRFKAFHPVDFLISLAAAGIGIFWFEVFKIVYRKKFF